MNARYDRFRSTALGRRIVAVIDSPGRLIELAAFSREGFPAVTALVSELTPVLMPLSAHDRRTFNFAKQFVGDYVGDMMRAQGYRKVREKKAVPGELFSYAAVWGR